MEMTLSQRVSALWKSLVGLLDGASPSAGPVDNRAAVTASQDPYDQRERGIERIPLENVNRSSPPTGRSFSNSPSIAFPANVHQATASSGRLNAPPLAPHLPPPPYGEHTRDPIATSNESTTMAANGSGSGSWRDRLIDRLRAGVNITVVAPLDAPPFIMAMPGWFMQDVEALGQRDVPDRRRRLGWLTGNWRSAWLVIGCVLLLSLPLTITLMMNGDMSNARDHAA
ncbi:hypothetical protein BKA70DRAFT_534427 [Coprinopsis sp. MPI-PUGE-AT-0042]|nr:hypothetical protein BKA70DRAFT_534427 [Coprinopsis sp. MPI-PUGE-AT-0042]